MATSDRTVRRHGQRALEISGRVGFGINAAQHVLIAVLALQIAWGNGARADHAGALGAVAAQPFGRTVLWLFVFVRCAVGGAFRPRGRSAGQRRGR